MELKDKIQLIARNKIEDSRGWFLKVINGFEQHLPAYTGEIYITVAEPLQNKGGHYHPLANEWFTLLEGKCKLKLYDMETKESLEILLDSNTPVTVYVPRGIAHYFLNEDETSKFILLAYTDQLYNPADTIPFLDFE